MHRVRSCSLVVLSIGVPLAATLAYSICGTDVVIVQGRVAHAPRSAVVRVQLVYSRHQYGESADVTVENGKFTLQIPFLTQSHAPVLMGNLGEKCDRKPTEVIVKLMNGDLSQEFDRVSLDFKEDFKMADPTAFVPRSNLVLSDIH